MFGSHRKAALSAAACMMLLAAAPARVEAQSAATADVKSRDGKPLGKIRLQETAAGVLIHARLEGLPPGPHAFHVTETGTCEGDFSSAGPIYNPLGARHGFLSEEGPMAGDLPNLHVPATGAVEVELLSPFLALSKQADVSLLDADGAAIVLHEKADDYRTDPDGAAGARIACGILVAAK